MHTCEPLGFLDSESSNSVIKLEKKKDRQTGKKKGRKEKKRKGEKRKERKRKTLSHPGCTYNNDPEPRARKGSGQASSKSGDG